MSLAGLNDDGSLQDLGLQMLADAFLPAEESLTLLRSQIATLIPTETTSSQAIVDHIFGSGGKYVRPAMFFLSSKLTGYRGEHLIPIGAVCEFVHCASLLHDDVVDNSQLRRNKPTANARWGDQAAVLVGDLIYSRASELMAATGKVELVSTFAAAIRKMSEGELIQLENVFNLEFPEDTYLKLLEFKTGVLIGAACRAAGILADAPAAQRAALDAFGINIGIAFQLMDDALDYVGDREVFGKPTRSDLLAGKVTMPIILLQKFLTDEEEASLRLALSRTAMTADDAEFAAKLVAKYGTDELTMERARAYTERALSEISAHFPESVHRAQLETLAKSLLFRIC